MRFMLQNPRCGLFMRMGTGKTVTCLTAVDMLMYEAAMLRRVLLFAPIRVAAISWPDEIAKWDHTKHLTYSFVHGADKRADIIAANNSDIVAVNYEGLQWLDNNKQLFPRFDMCIVDESTFVKNPTAFRTKILHKISRFIPKIVILSGSPAPNSLEDLWSQIFLLDRGQRLGDNITEYRRRYFFKSDTTYGCYLRTGAKKEIVDAIADIVMVVDQKDQEGIPPVHNNIVKIALPKKLQKKYEQLEQDFLTTLDSGYSIEALNQQAKTQKLRQFVSGFVYENGSTTSVVEIHTARLEALKELLTSLSGHNVLVAIQFRREVDLICKYLKKKIPFINSESNTKEDSVNIRLWQQGKLPILLAHPASIGHGMNLQSGGSDIIWFSLTWSLEHWEQYIARLARTGQLSAKVINHILIMADTIDEPIHSSLLRKDATQTGVLSSLKAWRNKKNETIRNGKSSGISARP